MLLCYHPPMRLAAAVLTVVVLTTAPSATAADPLSEARRLYNSGQYDAAQQAALEALKTPATAEGGRLVLGRIHLERFRRNADLDHLIFASNACRQGRSP